MAAAAAANLAGRPGVRVVVIGDTGTGKSSLVVAVATEQFPENVPKVMPHTRLPADYFPDRVPITIIDTSSRLSTLERLSTYWLPELRRIQLTRCLSSWWGASSTSGNCIFTTLVISTTTMKLECSVC
ncbi:hypothetical protein QYE76_011066 [Lolium multiflorum]|uniref:Uncharacterized protein n=1 Tax=Lolium multiflorum TaxID=4521 RepID=A0AAD8X597_LOLMU|nr:hypothetical protein QYE76_056802 [Lolium multiflorum]KAK1694369.1 hypothetical protein QYE76_011066 [Lolium multiflorum]